MKQINPQPANLNTSDFFTTEHLKVNLRSRSIRGGAVTLFAQSGKVAIQMSSTVFIARLLTPEDYGLVAMASIVIKFVQMFRNMGLSAAVVQKDQINHQQVSTLFWINTAISVIISLIVAATAPLFANFYHEPRLTNIMLVLSGTIVLGGLSLQHQALLKRQMRFSSLAQINLASLFVGLIAGMISAWYGAGYWALVILQIAIALSHNIGIWLACSWRPGLPVWNAGISSLLAFGGNLTAFNFVNYFSRNLDNVLIGRYWGSQELGLYAKAYQLLLLPIQQINSPLSSVALPTLSCLQNHPEQYRRYYYKALLSITSVGMPLVAFTFATAEQIISLLLGAEWLEVVPIFQWLMPAAFMGTFIVAEIWAYQSLGRTDRLFRIGVVMSAIDVGIFLISVRWGALGVAAAYGFSRPLMWIPRMLYCFRGTPLKLTELIATLSRPAIASLTAAALLVGSDRLSILPGNINLFWSLLLSLLLYTLFYLAIWLVLPRGRQTLWEMLQMLREFKSK